MLHWHTVIYKNLHQHAKQVLNVYVTDLKFWEYYKHDEARNLNGEKNMAFQNVVDEV